MMDFKNYFELTQLYGDYASAVDAADWDAWPEFFRKPRARVPFVDARL